jgi:anti-anti-sigma factor
MAEARPAATDPLFAFERDGDTLVVTPAADLRELEYARLESGAREILELLDRSHARNVVLDFCRTDYYGSTALAFFVKLWLRVKKRGGHMAFCNVSEHEKYILRITNLDHLWPVCATQQQALATVNPS